MSTKAPYRIRPVLFSIGFFFLLNADINIVDILPDAIGWGLICYALYGLHDLNHKLEQAIKYAAYLAFLSLARGFVLIGGNVYFNSSNTLLATFVFSLISLVLSILFALAFFEGLSHLSVMGDSPRVPTECSGARSFTLLFFGVKSILVVLPELVTLAESPDLLDVNSAMGFYNILDLKPYFTVIQFTIVTLLGVAWFIIIRQLFKTLKDDRELLTFLENRYISTILANGRLQLRRSLRMGLTLCAVGCFSLITIVMDKMNVLPEAFPAAFLLVGGIVLKKHHSSFKALKIPAVAVIASSLLVLAVELIIKETSVNYEFLKAMKDVPLDTISLVLSCVTAAGIAWCALELHRSMGELAYKHCLPGAKEDWEKTGSGEMILFYSLTAVSCAAKIILPNTLWQNSAVVFLLMAGGIGMALYITRRIFMTKDAVMKGTF